jgi:hypothetical protein
MHRQMAGVFVNIAGGSFESTRISSTAGVAISRLSMHPDRQFGFFENTLFYKRVFSVYSDVEVDLRNAAQMDGNSKLLLGRAYFTMRLQPHRIITFDLNGNYYQNFPTFDPRLIGTGLLDRFLFQGISSGVRLELPYRIGIYTNLGRSDRNDDMKASWNCLYGLSAGNLAGTGIRADLRYSKFDSSFGNGNYRSISLSREIGDSFRFELQGGQQDFVSSMSAQTRARFADCLASWLLGRHYMIEVGTTFYRGQVQRYNQYYLSLGYRFDFHRGGN